MKPRAAFTLIELIFVILLIGLLGAVGRSYFRADRLLDDTRYIASRLAQTRYEAIGFDHRSFGGAPVHEEVGCLTLDRADLEGNLSKAGAYRLHADTRIEVQGTGGNTICFDGKGRPHDGDFRLSTLLHKTADIEVSGGSETYRIRLYPVSGLAIMKTK
ncbi:type II secretion system protein [Hydrogenimonas sp. SS33]|uniref:pilus assembly FimT family protein n=1 Tax=Hydrogenimonas leucolamina TaxID=2954236 RepID=UPI00336C011B